MLRVRVCGPFLPRVRVQRKSVETCVVLTMSDEMMSDLRSNIWRLLGEEGVLSGSWGRRLSRAPHRAMWRRCQDDTNEISAGYACHELDVKVSRSGHHVNAETQRGAQARSTPEAADRCVAVGAEHRGIDGAEHRGTM